MEQTVTHRIEENVTKLATKMTQLHFYNHPELMDRYGPAGKEHCFRDAVFHLEYLVEAIKLDHPGMYSNYILWAAAMLEYRAVPASDLLDNILYLRQALTEVIDPEVASNVDPFIKYAREKLEQKSNFNLSYISDDNPLQNEANRYLKLLLDGQRNEAKILVDELVKNGTGIKDIYKFIFQPTQYEVGRLWQSNKITVAHEHYCTAATQLIMSGLYSHIFSSKRNGKTMVACSISGELHEMGIRMVTDFFEMDGWDTYYLGANMPNKNLIESVVEHKADLLAISITIPTHVSRVSLLIQQLKAHPSLSNLIVLVGGYPFINNPGLWEKVNADGCANDAENALEIAKSLIN